MGNENDDEFDIDAMWALTTDANEKLTRANALQEIARHLRENGSPEEALPAAQTAAYLFLEIGDETEYALSQWYLGGLLNDVKRYEEAIEPLQAAIPIFESTMNETLTANCLTELARAYKSLENRSAARDAIANALELHVSAGDTFWCGLAALELGDLEGSDGEHTKALETFERAFGFFQEVSDLSGVGRCHDRIAATLIELGRRPEALLHLRDAMRLAEYMNDEWRATYASYRLGWTLVSEGLYGEAMELLIQASAKNKQRRNFVNAALCDVQLAHAYSNIGRVDEALALYRTVRTVFFAAGKKDETAQVDVNIAIALQGEGEFMEAERLFFSAIETARELKDEWLERSTRLRLASHFGELGLPNRVIEVLDSVTIEAFGENLDDKANYLCLLAEANLALGDKDKAGAFATAVIDLGASPSIKVQTANAYAVLSKVLEETDPTEATNLLANAIALQLAAGQVDKATALSQHLMPSGGSLPKLQAFRKEEQPALFGEEPAEA